LSQHYRIQSRDICEAISEDHMESFPSPAH